MNEEDVKKLKNLHFTITKEFEDIVIEMLTTRQILNECELTPKDRKLLQKHFEKLRKRFATILKEQNPVEMQIIKTYLSSKRDRQKVVYLFSCESVKKIV